MVIMALLQVGDVFTSETLGEANYVVEKAGMAGGGTGHGPGDIYPDGWQVTVRQLAEDGSYDPDGESTYFYQSGCFSNLIEDAVLCEEKFRLVMTRSTMIRVVSGDS